MKQGMKVLLICAVTLVAARLAGKPLPKPQVKVPPTEARPRDVASIEAIVKADHECNSGPAGAARQWGRKLTLYDPHAKWFIVKKDSKTGALYTWSPTLQDYATENDGRFVQEGYMELEIAHKTLRVGNIATVLSTYEGRSSASDKMTSRGVYIYQLYYDGNRWWISSVSWDAERPIALIPDDLLPRT